MSFVFIALDPGGTTGYKTLTVNDDNTLTGEAGQLGPHEHHKELFDLLESFWMEDDMVVICERFEYRQNSRPGLVLDSREYIGVTKLFCVKYKKKLVLQSAAQGKGFVKDDHLKKLGLWMPGQQHARDATRHLIYYLVNGQHNYPHLKKAILEVAYK